MFSRICVIATFFASSFAVAQNSGLSCTTLEGNLHIMGDKCLAITAKQQRSTCFETIEKGIADGYKKQCGSTIDKIKAEYAAKENAKFPPTANKANTATGLSCATLDGNLHMMADKCLAMTTKQQRSTCFETMEKGIADGYKKQCGSTIDKIKAEYASKENAKYPNQAIANTGSNDKGNSNSGLSCATLEGNLHMMGDKCLAIATKQQRSTCFETIEKGIADGYKKQCGSTIDKLKAEYASKENAKYPNQATANNGGNDKGNNNSGLSCVTLEGNLHIMGDKCLAITAQQQRSTCFETIEKGIADGYKKQCGSTIDKLKAEYAAKENSKFPNQANTTKSTPTKPVDCSKLITETSNAAKKCLPMSNQSSRKVCFDAIGATISSNSLHDSCQGELDSLKRTVQDQERSKYPNQPTALE